MARLPPPPALSPEEFKRRWDSGARTMRDLDPSLAKWAENNARMARFNIVALTVGVLILLGMLVFLVIAGVLA